MTVVVTVTLISPPVCTPLFAVRGHTLFAPLLWPLCSSKTINTGLTTTRPLFSCSLSDLCLVAVVPLCPLDLMVPSGTVELLTGGAGFCGLIRHSGHSRTDFRPGKPSEVTRKWHLFDSLLISARLPRVWKLRSPAPAPCPLPVFML